MRIEAARTLVAHTPLGTAVEAQLRQQARVRSTHYSTRIEGNRLTLQEAQEVIANRRTTFSGRRRDVSEVRNYWHALLRVEEWAAKKTPLTEELIQRLHAIVQRGPRAKPSPYRTGQNVIRNAGTGEIVYLPPEAKDVGRLMAAMVRWASQAEKSGLPVPLIAALVHYQFVTIHPYYDGNGRTARLLATFILHRGGYSLNGFFSLEEHHARDLEGYYRSLAAHPHHNYYTGRAKADLTPWLGYFMATLSAVFDQVAREAMKLSQKRLPPEPEELRKLDRRARVVLGLLAKTETIVAADVAAALGLSARMARNLLQGWTREGWLQIANASRKTRAYRLAGKYRQFIGNLTAMET
jgi:Fic family protein